MGEAQCGICSGKGASRSMALCPECMQYVCENCFNAEQGCCIRCGSREYD